MYDHEIADGTNPRPKAPFTPVKEERPPTTEYHGHRKPKGFGLSCVKCHADWGKCKHSDGSKEAHKLDDKTTYFFFGCLVGLLASYAMINF